MAAASATVPTVAISAAAAALSGWTALRARRSLREGGGNAGVVVPLFWTTALFTGLALGYAVAVWLVPTEALGAVPIVGLMTLAVPWSVFALRYAGRGHLVTRGRVAVTAVASVVVVVPLVLTVVGVLPTDGEVTRALNLSVSILLLGVLGVVFLAAGLVVLSTYRHGGVSTANGAVVALPVGEMLFAGQVAGQVDPDTGRLLIGASFLVIGTTFALAVARYDVLSVRPGTSTLGVRAVVDEMEEAVLLVGARGDVVRANGRASELFGGPVEGRPLGDALGLDAGDLRDRETVSLWTTAGNRTFDPRVATLTDARGDAVGRTVTLIDVTDREIRSQRIQVLNRILRHNVRNELSAVEARAELGLDDDRDAETHLRRIRSIADDLERLSADARRVEKLMDDPRGPETVSLPAVVEDVVAGVVAGSGREPAVSTDVAPLELSLDPGLFRYALGNVVENAVVHNDADRPRVEVRAEETGEGVRLTVADDGPGIPAAERAVIEAGVEDARDHASSLGLWGTNWAVTALGGTLSLGESDLGGAAVTVELPRTGGDAGTGAAGRSAGSAVGGAAGRATGEPADHTEERPGDGSRSGGRASDGTTGRSESGSEGRAGGER